MDEKRFMPLYQFIVNEGSIPSPEEDEKRRNVIRKITQIVVAWIKRIAWQRRLPRQQIAATYATVLTYGSYGLGVHGSDSDIDALCIGPSFATIGKDFFIVLHNMLKNRPEVTEILCVKDAKVPLMRFKFDGISVDLPYAQLNLLAIPENVDVLNPYFMRNADETSWKSLSGVCANKCILQLVPNTEEFKLLLRCVKLWARRRGVYGNLHGFLGGIHLAILTAYVCRLHPNASSNILFTRFFDTFAHWQWPRPVELQDKTIPTTSETRPYMPIRLPCSPYEYCHSNITRSTYYKIRAELLRGYKITSEYQGPDFDCSVFDVFPFFKMYWRFIKIFLSTPDKDQLADWVGWVRSRLRCLILKLEEAQGFCDPNPTEYKDEDAGDPNSVFYWGLNTGRCALKDIESIELDFMKSINSGYQCRPGRMELSIVQASQLPKNIQFAYKNANATQGYWKIPEFNRQRIPVYSQHLPRHCVGYVSSGGEASNYARRLSSLQL